MLRILSVCSVPRVKHSCVLLSSVADPAVLAFSTLSLERHDFRKQLRNIKRVLRFPLQILSETFLILRRTERDMIRNVFWSSYKISVIFLSNVYWAVHHCNS